MNGADPAVATALAALTAALAGTATPRPSASPPVDPAFLDVTEFAERHRVSTKTVRRMIDDGMPHERVRRRLIRIELAKAETWIAEQTARGAAARGAELGRLTARRGAVKR